MSDTEVIEGEVIDDDIERERHSTDLVPSDNPSIVRRDEWTVEDLLGQVEKVTQVMQRAMKPDVHYGVIPGTTKPTLLKPGAERLCVLFRLRPDFKVERDWDTTDGVRHLTAIAECSLTHIPSDQVWASAIGLCSTRESRYGERTAERECPECGEPAIKRSKFADKDTGDKGWYCYAKIGGCGAQFGSVDVRITEQETGKVANPHIADTYNTVIKMAEKRALLAAVLNATAASDVFTQDMEEAVKDVGERHVPDPEPDIPKSWSELVEWWKDILKFDPLPWWRSAIIASEGVESRDQLSQAAQTQLFRKLVHVYLGLHPLGWAATVLKVKEQFDATFGMDIPTPEQRAHDEQRDRDDVINAAAESEADDPPGAGNDG